jgi:hypothetical protein
VEDYKVLVARRTTLANLQVMFCNLFIAVEMIRRVEAEKGISVGEGLYQRVALGIAVMGIWGI